MSRTAHQRPPNALLGTTLMGLSALSFATSHSLIRLVSDELSALQMSALRFAFGVLIISPLILHNRGQVLRTHRLGLHFAIGALNATITVTLFGAFTLMPLAEATALNFSVPLFTVLLAAIILRERVDGARWAATFVGFAGVLVILRPGFGEVSLAALLPIAAALQLAFGIMVVKKLTDTETTASIIVYQTIWPAALLMIAMLFVWTPPSTQALALTFVMGLLGSLGIFFMTRALELTEASILAPIDYTRLPLIAAIGFFAFDEKPDIWTWVGSAIIIAAAIYLVRREGRAR